MALFVSQSEAMGKLVFEVPDGAGGGPFLVDVVERSAEQVVEAGLGMLPFDGIFQKSAEIGGEKRAIVIAPDGWAAVLWGDFAEGMEFAAA